MRVFRILETTEDKYYRVCGFTEAEFNKVIDEDQSYASWLNKQGMMQHLLLENDTTVRAYTNLGAGETPYEVGDTFGD